MQILIQLVKISAIGASLAFLCLSYWLLRKEQALKNKRGNPVAPRAKMLRAITQFSLLALVFLIVGIISEFFLSHGPQIVTSFFKNEMVRVRFGTWSYGRDKPSIVFSLTEDRFDSARYILPGLRDQYDVYIGVRKRDATPVDHGQYNLIFGPYRLSNHANVEQVLTQDHLTALGDKCVVFAAFGIRRPDNGPTDIKPPFEPQTFGSRITIFNVAGACIPN